MDIQFVPTAEIDRIRRGFDDPFPRASVTADLFRLNALSMIAYAGSGHIGTSFSSLDIVTWLLTEVVEELAPAAAGAGTANFVEIQPPDVPGL